MINQIQDTFTDDASKQLPLKNGTLGAAAADLSLMTNIMPQSTATLEQQLLQSTAPGLKLSAPKDSNGSQLAQNLQDLLLQMQYVQNTNAKDINQSKELQQILNKENRSQAIQQYQKQQSQMQFEQSMPQNSNLASVFEMLLLKLVQEQEQPFKGNFDV